MPQPGDFFWEELPTPDYPANSIGFFNGVRPPFAYVDINGNIVIPQGKLNVGGFAGSPYFTNVKDYGAKGDGATDDTAAIQTALTAVPDATGGILIVPPGNYKCSSTLIVPQKIWVLGVGPQQSIFTFTNNGIGLDCHNGLGAFSYIGRRIILEGICVKGNAGAAAVGIRFGDNNKFTLRRVQVQDYTNAGGIGILAENLIQWTEESNFDGVKVDNSSNAIILRVNGGTNSFGYAHWYNVYLDLATFDGIIGLTLGANALLYNCMLDLIFSYGASVNSFGLDISGSIAHTSYLHAVAEGANPKWLHVRNGGTFAGITRIESYSAAPVKTVDGGGTFDPREAFFAGGLAQQGVLATGTGKTVDNVIAYLQGINLCRQA